MALSLQFAPFRIPRLRSADTYPLRPGEPDQGAVLRIQQALIDLGYDMPITTKNDTTPPDGKYGTETLATVKWFQKDQGFPAREQDGVIGRKTMTALDFAAVRVLGGPAVPPDAPPAADVRDLFIFFSGVGITNDPEQGHRIDPAGKNIASDVLALKPAPGHAKVVVRAWNGALFIKSGITEAADFIKANRDPNGLLIVYGYSAGGINAIQLCRQLPKSQTVDLLVTVDPATKGALSGVLDRSLPDNVAKSLNRFQTNMSPTGAFGGPTTGGKNLDSRDVTKDIEAKLGVTNRPEWEFKAVDAALRLKCHGEMEAFCKPTVMTAIRFALHTPMEK